MERLTLLDSWAKAKSGEKESAAANDH